MCVGNDHTTHLEASGDQIVHDVENAREYTKVLCQERLLVQSYYRK